MRPVNIVATWYHIFRERGRGFSDMRELKPCLGIGRVVVVREEGILSKGTL